MNKPFTAELLTKEFGPEFAGLADRLNQIVSEQSGWVKCSDRLPTKEDADEKNEVEVCSVGKLRIEIVDQFHCSYWRKIVKPEN